MDAGRYGLQQGWDSNSALEGYGAVNEPGFRVGESYNRRRHIDEGFPNDTSYPRTNLHRELLERDAYPPPASVSGIWPQSKRTFDDEFRDDHHFGDGYQDVDHYHEYGFDRPSRFGGRDNDSFGNDDYGYRRRASRHGKEGNHDVHESGRHNRDYERDRRDGSWRRRDSRDDDRSRRGPSYERDMSPPSRWEPSRSCSRGRDERSRSRSPRSRSHGRNYREDSYDETHYDRSERWRDHNPEDRRYSTSAGPSATVVVKGLSQKTTEEDLYKILADWGPLRHVRVIRERNSGISRGFAFIDFPSAGAARNMMDTVGDDGIIFDGRKFFFEYSSKPTGSAGPDNFVKSGNFRSNMQCDWMCTICGCLNFARRISCFQCNEGRTDDAPSADVASGNLIIAGKRGSDAGPTHVLVVRGLGENADEDMLRYEFSKHVPVKDIRLVRDKFTHVSRGFAFVHFHSVDDAAKALEATNGIKLVKDGQIMRVAFAKSIHGPACTGSSQSSSLAAAAIEAATFAQQYDAVGWAPKEYNSDETQAPGLDQNQVVQGQNSGMAPQSGFVWDEKSGYYYDASSGFYYDGNTGLYYDGNSGTWFSYDHQKQQYVPCVDQNDNGVSEKSVHETGKPSDDSSKKKAVISAPAATITSKGKASLPDAVQAAAAAALAAEKKEKEKLKEIKLASKSSLLASKKKMSNVLSMWKQRNHEGQTARVVLDNNQTPGLSDDKLSSTSNATVGVAAKNKFKSDVPSDTAVGGSGFASSATGHTQVNHFSSAASQISSDDQDVRRLVGNSTGGSLKGVIRSSGRGVVKSDTKYSAPSSDNASSLSPGSTSTSATTSAAIPFRTDAAALGSYAPSSSSAGGRRRFSETPAQSSREQPQATYRDRAAERRSLYGSSIGAVASELGGDSNHDSYGRGSSSDIGGMPFPPGVGGGPVPTDAQSYEVMTADRAIDEKNVGNRMLRNMGWQEGSGLGRDGSGIIEPVQAQGMEARAGLGRHQRKVDPELEAQAGDSYRTLMHKKAIARFREMA